VRRWTSGSSLLRLAFQKLLSTGLFSLLPDLAGLFFFVLSRLEHPLHHEFGLLLRLLQTRNQISYPPRLLLLLLEVTVGSIQVLLKGNLVLSRRLGNLGGPLIRHSLDDLLALCSLILRCLAQQGYCLVSVIELDGQGH